MSILDVEPIGSQFIAEFTGWSPKSYVEFSENEQQRILQAAGTNRNWFELWLRAKVESLAMDLGELNTDSGVVRTILERLERRRSGKEG